MAKHAAPDPNYPARFFWVVVVGVALVALLLSRVQHDSQARPVAKTTASVIAKPTPTSSRSVKIVVPTTPATTEPVKGTFSYTVQPGDTLTKLATWFQYNGYQKLYQENIKLISNPDLIYPGQKLTISPGGLTITVGK